MRLRLLTQDQLKAIQDNGLHEEMAGGCVDEVRRALDAVGHMHEGATERHLDGIAKALAANLQQGERLRAVVVEAVELGGGYSDEDSYFHAMALWVIDNQLGDGLSWASGTAVRRNQ
jgi:diaminopimelate decarboxylase